MIASLESVLSVQHKTRLYSWAEIPQHQQDNPYITDGYRAYLSAKQCCKSILLKSNELVNIWTHGVAFLLFFVFCFYDQLLLLSHAHATTLDRLVFLTFSICAQVCMLCSTLYHTFICHVHETVARRWYAADVIGIMAAMMGCYAIGLYLGFYCLKTLQAIYVSSVGVMMLVSGLLMAHPNYFNESWRCIRLTHLTLFTVSGLCPTIHWCLTVTALETKMFLFDVILLYLLLGVAFAVYLSKYPERCMPGRFNIVGHSHNWWHVLVVAALLHWRSFAFRVLRYRTSHSCDAGLEPL